MKKSIKNIVLLLLALPLFAGCESLFSKGDTEKVYTGEDLVAFKLTTNEIDEGNTQTLEIQFISNNGLAPSDIPVSISIDGSSTATTANYGAVPASATISAGSAATTISIDILDDPATVAGDEVTLILNLSSDVKVAEHLKQTIIYIQGVG
jgi:hypothetical protein